MAIDFERATATDVDAFIGIEKSLGNSPTYSPTTDRDEGLSEIEKNTVYLMRENGHVVGSVMYEIKSPDHAYISGLALRPESQGRGLGKMAMEKVLGELKDVPTIDLVTHPDNERAIALYESLGFKRGEIIENYFGDGQPRMVMALTR